MERKQNLAIILAGAVSLGALTGCGNNKSESQTSADSSQVVEVENAYKASSIDVKIVNTITGEQELYFFYNDRELFTNYNYFGSVLRVDSNHSFYEYVSLEDAKESYTLDELKKIFISLREEFHENNESKAWVKENDKDINNETQEKIYNTSNIYFVSKVNSKDNNNEIFLVRKEDGFATYLYYELFTDTYLGTYNTKGFNSYDDNSKLGMFSILDFIPASDLKETYTESELKSLLEYVREIYNSNGKIYSSNTLTLSN